MKYIKKFNESVEFNYELFQQLQNAIRKGSIDDIKAAFGNGAKCSYRFNMPLKNAIDISTKTGNTDILRLVLDEAIKEGIDLVDAINGKSSLRNWAEAAHDATKENMSKVLDLLDEYSK